jgi:hypothetical protein
MQPAACRAAAKPSGDEDDFADMAVDDAELPQGAAEPEAASPPSQQQTAGKATAKKPRRKKVCC